MAKHRFLQYGKVEGVLGVGQEDLDGKTWAVLEVDSGPRRSIATAHLDAATAHAVADDLHHQAAEMEGEHPFDPDWCLAPAVTLADWLRENHLSPRILAVACAGRGRAGEALAKIKEIIAGQPLTEEHAAMLAVGTFVPARFWLALERNYRAGLAAGKTDVSWREGDGG
jgi:hypothetical protein